MKRGNGSRPAFVFAFAAAAIMGEAHSAVAQGSGCWRMTDCRGTSPAPEPSADFRYESGRAPRADFRSPSGEPVDAGPRRLDGEPVTEAERWLLRPENMRFRQYAVPTWPRSAAGTEGAADQGSAKGYGQ